MKRIALIVLLVLMVASLTTTAVFAQTTTPPDGASTTSGTAVNRSALACGYGDLEGSANQGKLYVFPGFNLAKWMRIHHVTPDALTLASQKAGNANTSNVLQNTTCKVIILPSM